MILSGPFCQKIKKTKIFFCNDVIVCDVIKIKFDDVNVLMMSRELPGQRLVAKQLTELTLHLYSIGTVVLP